MLNNLPDVPHYSRLNPAPIYVMNLYNLSCNLSPALKYLARIGYKDDEVKELQKVVDYIGFEIMFDTQVYPKPDSQTIVEPSTHWKNPLQPIKLLESWDCKYKDLIVSLLEIVISPNTDHKVRLQQLKESVKMQLVIAKM